MTVRPSMARSLLFNVLFFVTTTLFVVIGSPFLFTPRSWAMAALKVHARFELFLLRVIVGTKIQVRGRENIPEGACLVASKHQSAWETFALIPIFRDPALLMKRELFWIPFHGWFSYKFQMIPVDRDKGPAALRRMLREARKRIDDGREIIIFPEGTRRPAGAPPDYKTGIVLLYDALGVPCLPVALNSGLFWPRRTVSRRPGTIVVEILPPIPPGLPKAEFLRRLETVIEGASNRLLAEAGVQEPARASAVNPSLT
ncbi:MAG: lysophospholipid acyltransferase family protein [Methyloceanibacter sp.]